MNHRFAFFRLFFAFVAWGMATLALATTVTISSSGNWTAPAGVTSITVEAWGAGGAGGGATSNPAKGGGGAGGQYARKVLTVTPGTKYAVVVGVGGVAGTGSGAAGGDSTFAGTSVVAKGGAGGTGAANGVAGAGSATGGVGDIVYAGGSGSSGSTSGTGGAGGGGAGSTGAGGAASGLSGGLGSANGGGDGAGGLSSRGSGNIGNDFGGGGGGGYATSSTTRSGGDGGNGQVVITYAQTPSVTTNAATSLTAGGATLNGLVTSNGGATTVTFEYGLTTAYGSTITASQSPAALDASGLAVSASITGLATATTYHFRVKGANSAGTANGSDRTFTTTAPPSVTSINRASFNPTKNGTSVAWTVVFSASVTGVDAADFSLVQSGGVTGAAITTVTGSGTTWTVTAGTGTGTTGILGLNLVDNDSINSGGVVLGGVGVNGNFTGQIYTLIASVCTGAADILFCDDFERSNPGSVGNGWTVTPTTASNCTGVTGNTGCAGIDSDIAPFNTATNPRPNPTRAMFTRWSPVSVDSPVVNLSVTTGAQVSYWLRRGRDTFSECPEGVGENYLVQYYASNNTWKPLAQYPSSPTAALCDGMIFTPTIELPADALHSKFKLRFYQPSGNGSNGTNGGATGVIGYDYWHMDDVVIRKATSPKYVGAFCDNFEAGLSRWSISAEGFASGNIGDASIGSLAYQSASHELDMRWGYGTAATFKTDLTGVSGDITFWLKSGATSALDPTTNENLVVEYMNSAGSWTVLNTYLGSAAAGTTYAATFALPADAKHAGFRLRFRQLAGSGYDKSYWHIDDVCVGSMVANTDLALTKTGDSTLIPGTNTAYTLRVTNNGPDALSGAIQVVDTLPTGLSYLGGSGSGWLCSANAQIVTCNWTGALAKAEIAPDLVITASVGASVTGSITNTAVLTGTGNDPVTSNNTASFSSGNFIPYFIFTNGPCVDGIAIGQSGQTCGPATWTSMIAGQSKTGVYITAVNASGVPTKLSSSASTTVSTQFGLSCHDPVADAGVKATFSAVSGSLPLCTGNGAEPTVWTSATSLTFLSGAPSIATSYTFNYADVGEIELYMRNSVATAQLGTSGAFVVKPAGLVLTEIKPTDTSVSGRCALPTTACANAATVPITSAITFVRAGEAFTATVKAVTTSGAVTPNFGKEITPESVALNPANVVAGMVAPPDVAGTFGAFSGGIATGIDFSWGEVGIITLTPSILDGDYLGAGDVTGTTSGNVGRFYPDHFAVLSSPSFTPGCSAGGFSYMDQPFDLAATLEARNLADTKTQNYSGEFAKGVVGLQMVNTNNSIPVPAVPRVSIDTARLGGLGTPAWNAGSYPFVATQFNKLSTGPDGPFDSLDIGLSVTDETSLAANARPHLMVRDMDASNASCTVDLTGRLTSGTVCSASKIASATKVRYGRLRMQNAYGSELLALPVLLEAQYMISSYWTGSSWTSSYYTTNTADSCTALPMSSVVMSGYTGGLAACETQITPTGTATLVNGKLPSPGLVLTKPGVGNQGSVNLAFNVSATAAGNTCVGATESAATAANMPWFGANPSARATFGIYKSPLIYRRENY